MIKNAFELASIILLLMITGACSDKNESKKDLATEPFYERDAGWDYMRIPLIKPYEAIKLKGSNSWNIKLHALKLQMSISNVKKVDVVKNVIVAYADSTLLKGEEVPEAWFVIIPDQQIEKGFSKKEDLIDYLSTYNIDEISLHDIDKISDLFVEKWPIKWDEI